MPKDGQGTACAYTVADFDGQRRHAPAGPQPALRGAPRLPRPRPGRHGGGHAQAQPLQRQEGHRRGTFVGKVKVAGPPSLRRARRRSSTTRSNRSRRGACSCISRGRSGSRSGSLTSRRRRRLQEKKPEAKTEDKKAADTKTNEKKPEGDKEDKGGKKKSPEKGKIKIKRKTRRRTRVINIEGAGYNLEDGASDAPKLDDALPRTYRQKLEKLEQIGRRYGRITYY